MHPEMQIVSLDRRKRVRLSSAYLSNIKSKHMSFSLSKLHSPKDRRTRGKLRVCLWVSGWGGGVIFFNLLQKSRHRHTLFPIHTPLQVYWVPPTPKSKQIHKNASKGLCSAYEGIPQRWVCCPISQDTNADFLQTI